MAEHNDLGRQGEDLAVHYLNQKGFRILERNSKWYGVEVDIITQKDNYLVFVEVKTRTNSMVPIDKIFPYVQRRRLIKAANFYVQTKGLDLDVRFDFILISVHKGKFEIEHIEDAFHPQW